MRDANGGSLVISPLAPNATLPPNNTGILTDPQTDFFLSSLGLSHIWTRPHSESQSVHPNTNTTYEIPAVGIFIDRNRDDDPNQLSLSDDESICEAINSDEGLKNCSEETTEKQSLECRHQILETFDRKSDVINFDDDDIYYTSNVRLGLQLPSPKGLNFPPQTESHSI